MLSKNINTDFLIIGSGLAGLNAAYHASKYGKVLVLTKNDFKNSNSWLAQGGVAAAIGDNDSTDLHYSDTLSAGREICDEDSVRILVEEGKERILDLIKKGMKLDMRRGFYSLGMEGGHSVRRILHANGNSTGQALTEFLLQQLSKDANIRILKNTNCIELIKIDNKVVGCSAHNYQNNSIITIESKSTIMATGGYSRLFKRSTNSLSSIGEGISIAMSAGVRIRDMEFIQFHPTAFYSKTGDSFLITEAVRGEGAYLRNERLKRFMKGNHDLMELAPRDIISIAIYNEIINSQIEHVYLDIRHLDDNHIKKRFPNIYRYALKYSIDITSMLIPVAPAAHYSIGGIDTDQNGKTNIAGLFACGEVAATGIHGANRLASNSLLECLVFSRRAVVQAAEENITQKNKFLPKKSYKISRSSLSDYISMKQKIQNIFINHVGIVRNQKNLELAKHRLANMMNRISNSHNDIAIIKLIGLQKLAAAIIDSALARKESRGTHQRNDFPIPNEYLLGNFYLENSDLTFKEKKWKLKKSI